MKIAYFSPVNPQMTGISDYSERDLLPYLSKYMDIDIFVDSNIYPSNTYLTKKFNVYPYTDFDKLKNNYDIPLYHMGNSQYHEFIYQSLLRNPGIIIFHDIFLHGFLYSLSLAKRNIKRYKEEFHYCYGMKGLSVAENAIQTSNFPEFEYPLIKRMLDHSVGIICHNEFCIQTALKEKSNINITKIDQPMVIPKEIYELNKQNHSKIKLDLSLKSKNPIIVSFGFISPHKRYPVLLKAFKRLLLKFPEAILILVGRDLMGIENLINSLEIKPSVKLTGFVRFSEIINYLAIADYCINLRYPTAGETGASVLRIMAAQKPVIVSDVGWFSEIPNDCCFKVTVDSEEEDSLLEHMEFLASNSEIRINTGINALKYVEQFHNPEIIARKFYKYIESVINGNEIVLTHVSEILLDLGIDENDDEIIRTVSNSIRGLIK